MTGEGNSDYSCFKSIWPVKHLIYSFFMCTLYINKYKFLLSLKSRRNGNGCTENNGL